MLFWTSRYRPVARSLSNFTAQYSSAAAGRQHDPLRILFCGADEFSIYSLRALRALQQAQPDKIEDISVVCRTDKRVGRGFKNIQEVPIKGVATELGLNLHQINTFTGWSPPKPFNLVVAVSFGLLVPARVLNGSQYGGLNVHPSLLPDLRGPAPIQHAILQRRSHTGVTVQTMHPTRFDHGQLIAQTSPDAVPLSKESDPHQLVHKLGEIGANLLCNSISEGLFVEPVVDLSKSLPDGPISHAPKIVPEDRHIDWNTWTADEIQVRDRVLGRLWDHTTFGRCVTLGDDGPVKRVSFQGPWFIGTDASATELMSPGTVHLLQSEEGNSDGVLAIRTSDGLSIRPSAATIDGQKKDRALPTLTKHLREAEDYAARRTGDE